jgi:hypothetical protein
VARSGSGGESSPVDARPVTRKDEITIVPPGCTCPYRRWYSRS